MGKIIQYPFPVIFQFGTTFWRGWIISFLSSRFILTFTCSTSLSPEVHQYLSEISLVVHLLVPYVFHWFFLAFFSYLVNCKMKVREIAFWRICSMRMVSFLLEYSLGVDSAFTFLLSKLNNGFGRDIRASFSTQISLYSILKQYLVFMMSIPYCPLLAINPAFPLPSLTSGPSFSPSFWTSPFPIPK